MNTLEQQIAALPVAEPTPELDERVRGALRSCHSESPVVPVGRGFRISAVGLIAAACLLIGAVAGFTGAGIEFAGPENRSGGHPAGPVAFSTAGPDDRGEFRDPSALLTAHLVESRFGRCEQCHLAGDDGARQLSALRLFAREQATAWEASSGDQFLVASHVSDIRFAECRQCHVAAESVKAL